MNGVSFGNSPIRPYPAQKFAGAPSVRFGETTAADEPKETTKPEAGNGENTAPQEGGGFLKKAGSFLKKVILFPFKVVIAPFKWVFDKLSGKGKDEAAEAPKDESGTEKPAGDHAHEACADDCHTGDAAGGGDCCPPGGDEAPKN